MVSTRAAQRRSLRGLLDDLRDDDILYVARRYATTGGVAHHSRRRNWLKKVSSMNVLPRRSDYYRSLILIGF
jgi:hypothetical protein